MFRKVLLIITLILFSVFSLQSQVKAVDQQKTEADLPAVRQEFATSYDVIYDIGEDGVTTITEKITLRNLTSLFFAREFKITIGATQISDIKASDSSGPMEVSSEQKDSSTTIAVKFNQQVAGLGKTLPWTLSFKSKDFAEKQGKVWEVRAPRISSSTNLENYNLTISVPQNFGEPSLITPTPKSQSLSSGRLFLIFDKSQIQQSGVSANFGTSQLFDFDLTYHLTNSNLFPILTNIALPPDTSFQDVIFQRIEPKPINVTVDDDGNYLAWYRLKRGQKMDIKVVGSVKLYTNSKVNNPSLDKTLKDKYLRSDKYWEKDNPQIVSKLNEILGENPSQDTEEKAKLIYHYVVNFLKYDPSRLSKNAERFGAVTALNHPAEAVCIEFTDLFIALARAAGIPAREVDGYGYSTNANLRPLSLSKDILHAWPEYWNEKRGWVMVDPTWEATTGGVDYFSKLDLNHFTFAIKGLSSQQPVSAGSYKRSLQSQSDLKYSGEDSHDVKVTLAENDFLGKPQLDVKIETGQPFFAGFPGKIKVKINNLGNALYPSSNLLVTSGKLNLLGSNSQNLGPIPAFGQASYEFNIRTKSLFDNYNDELTLQIGGQKFTKQISIKPFFVFQSIPVMLIGMLGLMVLIYGVVLGGFIHRKRIVKKHK